MQLWKAVLTVTIVLVGLTTNGLAQGYESIFGDSSTSWKVLRWGGLRKGVEIDSLTIKRTIEKNGKTYKSFQSYPNIKNSLREDTSTGKVWYHGINKEKLIMNMSLNKGDSFYLNYYARRDFDTGWYSVDTVVSKNDRRVILLMDSNKTEPFDTLKFIEGVGPNIGFHWDYGNYHYLICSYKDGKEVFFDRSPSSLFKSTFDTVFRVCPGKGQGLLNSGYSESYPKLEIYPNPAKSSTKIRFRNDDLIERPIAFNLYNPNGKQLRSIKINHRDAIQIHKPGRGHLYFYRLLDKDRQLLKSGKIIFTE